ncbi:MAG: hypothetical protein R6W86_09400 [Marinobacter sp.]|uniref:hypothetical protein n=1 Tax=Marinobacter sp. TaxID=50741 RepID=UPI00396D158E
MRIIQVLILVFVSLSAFAQEKNLFESVTVGFKVTKPDDWNFISAEQNRESLERFQMTDKEFHQQMVKYSSAPLVAMMKYPEPFEDLNPSFKVNIKPLGQLKGSDPKEILNLILPQFKKVFQDFNLTQRPTDTEVDGLPAAYMRINYSLAVPDGRVFPTTSELWIVPRGDYFFMIGSGTRQDEKTGSREEISEILSSVEL